MFGANVSGFHFSGLFLPQQNDAPRALGESLPHDSSSLLQLTVRSRVIFRILQCHMSALYGIFNFDKNPVGPETLASLQGALRAHGADGGGTWRGENLGLGAHLAHRTPEDLFEVQPLVCLDSGRVLISDARLDARAELVEALGLEDARETSDSLLIMRAFDKWGVECMSQLLGDWAFALWDAPKHRLVLARDRMGARPLCWHRNAERLAFATSAGALTALPAVERQLNLDVVADMLAGNPVDSTRSVYRDIAELPLASRMIVTRDHVHIEPYWKPDYGHQVRLNSDDEYVEAFRELFDRVMRDQMRSIAPIAVMMSGGLDSASVGATAAKLAPDQTVTAFTEVPREGFEGKVIPRRYADETPYVQAIAQLYPNLDLEFVRQGDKNLLHDADNHLKFHDGPFGTAANRVWWEQILEMASQRGCKTVMDGMQGNVAFSWNGGGLIAELLRGGQVRRAVRELRHEVENGTQKAVWRGLIRTGIMPMMPPRLRDSFVAWRTGKAEVQNEALKPLIQADFARQHGMEARVAAGNAFLASISGVQTPEIRWSYFLLGNGSGASTAAYNARFGVDIRHPLCDSRLVEWCIGVPESQCKRDGQPRHLVRRAMSDRLPPLIVDNPKRGLQAADWLEHLIAARPAIEEELANIEASPTATSILDVAPLRKLVDEWPDDLDSSSWSALDDYRITLEHGVMFGRYLRSFD